ncbi:cytochrome c biogenesis protein CcdA [Jiulongibacter sp. NS-SX5]|uniref:cytochrome c biogenesis protein CcdA n=1 Tax=Jiulongibacter sp. NS-SX5 TaxID=3463854 RepID=UPI0040582B67
MKRSIQILSVLLLLSQFSIAQILTPTTWEFKPAKSEVKVGDVVELEFHATIQKDWYLYSSDFDPNLGPIVTEVEFTPNDSYQLVGGLVPISPKKKYDDLWGGDITYFTKKGKFIQKVKILKPAAQIKGEISFQSCTDVDGRCVNGDQNFTFNVKGIAASAVATPEAAIKTTQSEAASIEKDGTRTALAEEDDKTEAAIETLPQVTNENEETTLTENTGVVNSDTPVAANSEEATSLWKFLLLALGAGFASIFMPCIYPIMPMTVSFFTKQENGKSKAFFYGISIMAIFAVMGLVTMAFGAPFLNFISTHWIPNLIFFIIFIIFGISLLGAFEIVLPHGAVNKIDRMSDRGGMIGIFFMALTLVVVSFSCTVPFVGSLLILSAQGEVLRPLYGMLAFGLPFAAVFTSLAMFPQWLKNLPKSGGWLNELKAVFGFLEFALALKFLSNIDLAYHWNLIHRNIFILVWVVIAILIGLYILGFLRLPKDSKVEKLSFARIAYSLVFFALAAYMIPGVTNKSLSLLSGILPPMPTTQVSGTIKPLANEKMKALPHGLQGFKDYHDALAYSGEVGKPVLIDFTGYACANCRKMEEFVWPKEGVLQRLSEDFVIASLYVDDKADLPIEKHYVSSYDNEKKTTVGAKNMDLEITKFNNNAQPYYAVVNAEGEPLLDPIGYSSEEEFIDFLDKGKSLHQ